MPRGQKFKEASVDVSVETVKVLDDLSEAGKLFAVSVEVEHAVFFVGPDCFAHPSVGKGAHFTFARPTIIQERIRLGPCRR